METKCIEEPTTSSDSYGKSVPKILIFADGSCLKNGMPDAQSGAGAVLINEENSRIKLKACYLGALTNQQAEIMACIIALEDLKMPARVEIFSDSKYVIDTMMGINRMKTNRPFWSRLVTACLRHHITWNWIRGHSGDLFQETADRLSRAAATAKTSLDKDTLDRLARLLQGKPDEETVRMIHDALKAIAAVCDGARKLDHKGFNKLDTAAGHDFARKRHLDRQEAITGLGLLGSYRGQVALIDGRLVLLL